jgi:integrase
MGVTVRQKVKGKGKPWWVFIAHNGKRKSIRVGDKAAAEALAAKIQEQLTLGKVDLAPRPNVPTFGEYARKKFLEGYVKANKKASTYSSYESILRNHLEPFARVPLDQLVRPAIREMIFEKLKKKLAPNTVRNIKAVISGVLSHALEDGLIAANPASRLGKFIKTKDRKADINPLTREEARDLLAVMAEHYPRHYPLFLCLLRTGMRIGEALALEWGAVDFRGGFIEVRRAYTKGAYTTPKNGKIRRVDMSPQLADTLKELRTERKREALEKWQGQVPDVVFVNRDGRMMCYYHLLPRVLHPALAKAGLRRIRIHDLRHTFASLLIQNGESLAYVKDQLGHGSISITVDTYGHLVPGANREAVAKLDDEICTYGQKTGCT